MNYANKNLSWFTITGKGSESDPILLFHCLVKNQRTFGERKSTVNYKFYSVINLIGFNIQTFSFLSPINYFFQGTFKIDRADCISGS